MNGSKDEKGRQGQGHVRLREVREGAEYTRSVDRPDTPPREIIVKLKEGTRLTQEDEGVFSYGGMRLTDIFGRVLSTVRHEIRPSFPGFSHRLLVDGRLETGEGDTGPEPQQVSRGGIDLFVRIRMLDPDMDEGRLSVLVADLRELDQVAHAVRAVPDATVPPGLPPDLVAAYQWYLAPGSEGGIDAYYAWNVAGGAGKGVRVCVCDASFCKEQMQLPGDLEILDRILPEPEDAAPSQIRHGTMTLGMLAAVFDPERIGMKGICHEADFLFSTTLGDDGVLKAIDRALASGALGQGDVLVVEAQKSLALLAGEFGGRDMVPVEVDVDVRAALFRAATEYGVTVIEPAGNGYEELRSVDDGDELVWDPDEESDDSLAIIVGAGRHCAAEAPRARVDSSNNGARVENSNYGARVDCQGWGENVASMTCHQGNEGKLFYEDAHSYTDSFNGTSSAAAMVAGVVACLQGVRREAGVACLSPGKVRDLLRSEDMGTPEASLLGNHEIGPLPDLRKLLLQQAAVLVPDY